MQDVAQLACAQALRTIASVGLAVVALSACDPADPEPDGGSCSLDVSIGEPDAPSFTPVMDGDPVELVLGFQGFRMLRLSLRVTGAAAEEAEVNAFVTVSETDVEIGQRTRETALTPIEGGFVLSQWLLFFNDAPPSSVVGYPAEIEVVVRAGGCVGGARASVVIRDDDDCVDHSIVLDAGALDAGLADAAACGDGS